MKQATAFLLLLALLGLLFGCGSSTDAPLLTVHFLDVGQGDAILLRTGEGDILIDAGTEDSEFYLCSRLKELGVKSLLLAVFTHLDEDHIGGADGVLNQFAPREIWLSNMPVWEVGADLSVSRLMEAASKCGAEVTVVKRGDSYAISSLTISVLSPIDDKEQDANRGSIVLKLHCDKTNAIFTGDADTAMEAELIRLFGASQLDCDLYKAGHHGSSTSGSQAFLQAMTPEWTVISCGEGNMYGHPSGLVLSNLEQVGSTVLRTDLLGEIVFVCDGERWTPAEK